MSGPVYDRFGVRVHHGNCLDVLRAMADESVHAVITDPPYGLADHKAEVVTSALVAWAQGDRERVPTGKGFMGREWDAFVPPPAVWDECLRVLKPGGHLAVFAGSRTVDLMGLSIRLAGFEMRDGIAAWLYGCLTADTEVLTEHGWRHGMDVEQGDRVAQWDPATGAISLAEVQETFRGPWDGPMRVLRNADTDQALTPNHRVYHRARRREQVEGVRRSWYGEAWSVAEAGNLSTWNPTQLPVAGEHDGPGIGGVDYAALLGWVWTEGGFDPSGTGTRIYQSSVNAAKVAEIDALLDRLGPHKRYDRERTWQGRTYVETTWFISGELAEQVRADLPGKRPTYALLWRMTGAEKRALRDAALLGDGHVDPRGTWQFYQRHEDDLTWFSTLLALVGQAGKVGMRPDRDNGTVYIRDRATTELQARHLRDATEHYQGEVWCVRVPTGAFVARRNGRVFITGNSGFPKSLDVGKALDKAAGATREVIGPGRWAGRESEHDLGIVNDDAWQGGADRVTTAPATDAAREWQGWGTALKPAHEPILLARKPLALATGRPATVAANVLAHRAGALNVDACRVAGDARPKMTRTANITAASSMSGVSTGSTSSGEMTDQGRCPTNVVLAHHPECGPDEAPGPCVPGCQVAALDEQSGTRRPGERPANREGIGYHDNDRNRSGTNGERVVLDAGGASRFFPSFRYCGKADASERPVVDGRGHPTVKPLALMAWLVRLLTPPGGVVLDPFAGSGSTGQAARGEGVEAVLVEQDAHHIRLIEARLDARPRTEAPLEPGTAPAPADDHPADLFDLIAADEPDAA